MTVAWAVTPEKIDAAVKRIVEVARPRRVILFGSAVRGDGDIPGDLDVLVVVDEEDVDPLKESVRIDKALHGILMPMDILVISVGKLGELADKPGLIYREILRTGRVVYEADR
jgi:predicted nucleotidyltransferase